MTSKMTEALEILVWLAEKRDESEHHGITAAQDIAPIYQGVIDYICEEYGYSQDDFPIYWKCGYCGGHGTIGDRMCPKCGGAGYDLTPMLQPYSGEDEED